MKEHDDDRKVRLFDRAVWKDEHLGMMFLKERESQKKKKQNEKANGKHTMKREKHSKTENNAFSEVVRDAHTKGTNAKKKQRQVSINNAFQKNKNERKKFTTNQTHLAMPSTSI